ncbi:MAG TPA: MqnA/MqnD/SBP family protein, partial [Candidatus Baltobacteraceae bacterium]|nr:MqnA/MqnD/SBP family protein [Candidatus Baltobacteraceae bacterium]
LGRGCGPLVVALPGPDGTAPPLSSLRPHVRIAIPGALTTAYLLFRLAFGRPIEAAPMRFDRIVDAVTRGEADAGLIIHESRFTYEKAGLVLVEDLGAWWERETGLPIPLGAILARRDLSIDDEELLQSTIRASLAFARANEAAVAPYVREHATEMDEDVMRAHIALYVNEFTDDIGDEGIKAVHQLFELAGEARILPRGIRPQFV